MRKLRICIYGGTELPEPAARFIAQLARSILGKLDVVLVTGGFHHFRKYPGRTSTDCAALRGAAEYAREANVEVQDCFEAWIPSPELDRNRELGGVVRMSEEEHGVRVRVMGERSALRRRLALVREVDAIITIAGRRHTEIVLEEALETNTPVLPLAFARGDSKRFWKANKKQIVQWFSLAENEVARLEQLDLEDLPEHVDESIDIIVKALERARVGKCLVLLPYDATSDKLYRGIIEPAVDSVMLAERLDYHPESDVIRDNFYRQIQESAAVIADVTVVNPNVMYEIGYAHGRGMMPLLFHRRRPGQVGTPGDLPVYLRDLNIAVIDLDSELAERIQDYLRAAKIRRPESTADGTPQDPTSL